MNDATQNQQADDQKKDEGPKPGSDEYNQQMAAQYRDQKQKAADESQPEPGSPEAQAAQQVPAKPQGGHDKFYDAETGAYNWEAHARELEYNANGRDQGDQKETPGEQKETPSPEGAAEIVEGAGLSVDDVANYIRENGTIKDEHRAVLKEKAGLTDALIDGYIDGEKAKAAVAQQQYNSAIEYAGGKETWDQLSGWGHENLNDAQKNYVNELLDGPDWKQGIDQLREWQGAASPASRGSMIAADGPSSGVVGYDSRDQMKADINSKEYRQDPAFRQKVMAKIAVSKFEGDKTL